MEDIFLSLFSFASLSIFFFYFLVPTPTTGIKIGFLFSWPSVFCELCAHLQTEVSAKFILFPSFPPEFVERLFLRRCDPSTEIKMKNPTPINTTHLDKDGTCSTLPSFNDMVQASCHGWPWTTALFTLTLLHSMLSKGQIEKKVQNWIKLSSRLKCEPERNDKKCWWKFIFREISFFLSISVEKSKLTFLLQSQIIWLKGSHPSIWVWWIVRWWKSFTVTSTEARESKAEMFPLY